jgi:hypothetical protein
LRRWCFAGSVFTTFILTVTLVSCGGSASIQNKQAPSASGGATTPSSATVIADIDDINKWLTCGACGNAGGTGVIAAYSDTVGIASPSEDGAAIQFSIAATSPFTNGYFFQEHDPIHTQFAQLTYEFDLFIPSGFENSPQAIEFELQQQLNGWIYNFSWQADYGSNTWRIFNYGAKHWDSTGIALQHFTPGTWHHIVAEYHNDASTHSVFHDALTIDGVRTPVNIRHDAFSSGNSSDEFTNAVQLDSNNVPSPFSIFVDKMKITYQ